MAVQRFAKYQYETSPRKLEPEYDPYPKKRVQKKPSTAYTKKEENKKEKKQATKRKRTIILYVIITFAILLTISYRNSLINESFNETEELKKNLASIQKENEQLRVNIENSLNLKNIEQSAKEQIGMQKLNNSQKRYISLDKKDYVEPATEKIEVENEKNWFETILEWINKIY